MIGDLSGWHSVGYWAALVGLVLFGTLYNLAVAWLERRHFDEGLTALLVVVGTLVTLIAVSPWIGVEAAVKLLLGFAASGTPMLVGSLWRYTQKRDRLRRLHD